MTNDQIIRHWLDRVRESQDIAAGVFFDDSDNLSVMTRDGLVEPFYSSPFFQRLDQCIVYLDDAHTRGTDLKLPPHFRALVTLGPGVTKDKLVQGKFLFLLSRNFFYLYTNRLYEDAQSRLRSIRGFLRPTRS